MPDNSSFSADLDRAIQRALDALLARRNSEGYWEGRLSSSPLATAVALCALDPSPQPPPARGGGAGDASPPAPLPHGERGAGAWEYLCKTQNADGGWGDTEISKSNLAATLLVLCAVKLQGSGIRGQGSENSIADDQIRRAQSYVDSLGGLRDGLRRVYGKDLTFQAPIRMTAACAGLLPWSEVDTLPFELALAPRALMGALRLPVVSYAIPALVCVGLARHAQAPSRILPLRWLRAACAERALKLALSMQPESGGYLEAIPITAFCLLGLNAAGRGEHPIALNARKFLLNTQREDGSWPVEVNLSVWNTTRAIDALAAGGLLETALNETERAKTRDWLLAQQTKGKSVYSDAQPGGWGWNHLSGSVPDVDDTSGAMLALRALGVMTDHPALKSGRTWLHKLQNDDDGWPTFCRGWQKLPFDRSAPDLTAHAKRAICEHWTDIKSVVKVGFYTTIWLYLAKEQRPDGSFAPLWFGCEHAMDETNYTYGTSHVLLACGPDDPQIVQQHKTRALAWLRSIQNPDGGFGGCAGAPSTAEETGLALRALVASGVDPEEECCARAAKWLIEHQRSDGSWNPAPIGFYFAVLWYYEELYPLVYALGGLGALRAARVKKVTSEK